MRDWLHNLYLLNMEALHHVSSVKASITDPDTGSSIVRPPKISSLGFWKRCLDRTKLANNIHELISIKK